MKLQAIVRLPILLVVLVVASGVGTAGAATVRVGLNEGASSEPPLTDPCYPGCTLEVYLALEDPAVDPADRVASVFQADLDILTSGSWNTSVDLSEVDPGLEPIGVGTWPSAVANLASTQVSESLTSDNLGGERLVLQLEIFPTTPGQFELSLGSDPARTFIARDDVTAGVVPVPLTGPALGSQLFVVPEPSCATLLIAGTAGLMVLAAVRRRLERVPGA